MIGFGSIFYSPKLPDSVFETILFIFGIPCFLAFWILPGIIYEDEWEGPVYGLKPVNLRYNVFFMITLGIGPTYIFFKKYDPILKEYFKSQDSEPKKS